MCFSDYACTLCECLCVPGLRFSHLYGNRIKKTLHHGIPTHTRITRSHARLFSVFLLLGVSSGWIICTCVCGSVFFFFCQAQIFSLASFFHSSGEKWFYGSLHPEQDADQTDPSHLQQDQQVHFRIPEYRGCVRHWQLQRNKPR